MIRPPAESPGYQVGLAGASTLLGQEILRVLHDRAFPVRQLFKFETETEEPDLPVLDLSGQVGFEPNVMDEEPESLDVLFLAARPHSKSGESDLLGKALAAAGATAMSPGQASCVVIDSSNALAEVPGRRLSIPSCPKAPSAASENNLATVLVSPHPATIVLSRILLSLAARYAVKDCVAQIFLPASELGPRGIEELQKQAVSLLSFQKPPQKVFGAQMAFNLLARLPGKHAAEITVSESAIRREVRECLSGSLPLPALCFSHAAVFYSLAFSIFVELGEKPAKDDVTAALSGSGMTVRRRSEAAPNQVDAAGSAEILLDAITSDPDRLGGFWIWAAVDNIRLAAENAVDIAEHSLSARQRKQ